MTEQVIHSLAAVLVWSVKKDLAITGIGNQRPPEMQERRIREAPIPVMHSAFKKQAVERHSWVAPAAEEITQPPGPAAAAYTPANGYRPPGRPQGRVRQFRSCHTADPGSFSRVFNASTPTRT